ncbi:hypothetical protein [Saccharothrix sp. NRRL B-16348]|uniref:hypothetical protein n=1 Tax=Saccharothrix sp. NRRL B-16348 TaxID=1415542 RepID=UPI0009EC5AA1
MESSHTYYARAGTVPVLVHNCGSGDPLDEAREARDRLARAVAHSAWSPVRAPEFNAPTAVAVLEACDERAGFLLFRRQGRCRGDSGDTWDRSSRPSAPGRSDGSGFPDESPAATWRDRGARLTGRLASALRLRTKCHTVRGNACSMLESGLCRHSHCGCGADLEQAVELNDARQLRTAVNGTG